jgi:hypothetical protein
MGVSFLPPLPSSIRPERPIGHSMLLVLVIAVLAIVLAAAAVIWDEYQAPGLRSVYHDKNLWILPP